MFTLTFTEPGRKPQSHPLAQGQMLVGRDATCDVVLSSKDVSRRHARFFVRGGELLVEDLGSQNGVYLRGARVEKATQVPSGASLEIGDVQVAVADAPAAEGAGAGAVLRGKGRDFKLPAKAVVGRGADCDVVLDDDSVSRRHAELARDDRGLYRLRDLESANGTFLDGKPVGTGPVLVPDRSKLRLGDVELLFWRPPPAQAASRRAALVGALLAASALVAALVLLRPSRAPPPEPGESDQSAALIDKAQAALDGDRFEEAARLAQAALDRDPLAAAPRKVLAQARREQENQKYYGDALAKAQVGREDEALSLLAQVSPQSRFFARARIKAKDLAQTVLRVRGASCRSVSRDNPQEVAEECSRALDVKCQLGAVESDAMLKALRAAEKALPRRVPWSCPQALAALFRDEGTAGGPALDEKLLAALYPDAGVRGAMAAYARGEVSEALRKLGRQPELVERIKVVDGRFREGQTAILGGALDRADQLWGEALQADSALMPAGVASFFSLQMRSSLSQAHAKVGDERFQRGQYSGAYDEWTKGLAVSPRDPHLLDQLARLEKVAEGIVSAGGATCDQLSVAARITRADPPSPAHQAAQQGLSRCR